MAAELGRLDAALDRAGQGQQPQVLLLAGEAGVGKTRLLAAFADRARGPGVRDRAGRAAGRAPRRPALGPGDAGSPWWPGAT
jgi:AAA ATPase-like protein